jgi:trehalose/maltose transport system substrate-binding protein
MKVRRQFVVAAFGLLAASAAQAATVAISCAALGREFEICRQGAEAWAARTGNTVRLVSTPNSGSERLALYQQLLAAHAPELDVLQIDVVWPGILARHLVDLSAAAARVRDAFYPQLVRNDMVSGRLVALPWFVDVGLLYYRSDLLARYDAQVPRTWQELTETAARIQRAEQSANGPRLWGFVWQGRTYEGLTCNALEWLASQGGGTIVDPAGDVTVNNSRAAAAITRAARWVGHISPKGVLNYAEEESRGVFQSGQAVFMRNWPYAWNLLQNRDSPVRGKVGVALLPAAPDGHPAAALGGQQLAVSRYSRNREAATSLVLYLTGSAEQKRRALVGGYHPTIPALYDDPEILASSPLFGTLRNALDDVVARPSTAVGPDYNRVSYAFANAVHTVLAGQSDAESSLRALERQLRRLKRRGNWPAAASGEAHQ